MQTMLFGLKYLCNYIFGAVYASITLNGWACVGVNGYVHKETWACVYVCELFKSFTQRNVKMVLRYGQKYHPQTHSRARKSWNHRHNVLRYMLSCDASHKVSHYQCSSSYIHCVRLNNYYYLWFGCSSCRSFWHVSLSHRVVWFLLSSLW